jgi:hypothetical protein
MMLVTKEIAVCSRLKDWWFLYAAGGKIDGKLCCRWKDHCNIMLVTREIEAYYTAGRKIDGFICCWWKD